MSHSRGRPIRIVAVIFFALLALQLALRYALPEPRPTWLRISIIACCVGIFACLVIQFLAERDEHPEDETPPGAG